MIINFRRMKAEKVFWGTNGQILPKFDGLDFYDPKVQHTPCQKKKSTPDPVHLRRGR